MAILSVILFPVFARVREGGRRSSCLSNLKQAGLASQLYVQDYDGVSLRVWNSPNSSFANPLGESWPVDLWPYAKSERIWVCPSAGPSLSWGNDAQTHDACWGSATGGSFAVVGSGTGTAVQAPPRVCYGLNSQTQGQKEALFTSPSTTLQSADSVWIDISSTQYARFVRASRHLEGINVLYFDGHVKWCKDSNIAELRWAP